MTKHAPNLLTILRVALVPVFCWLLFADWQWLSLIVFWVAGITDLLDGWLARKRGLVSSFGKLADPIADKALTGAAWISLSILGVIAWPATMLIMIREVGITVMRLMIAETQVVPASKGGKWKTTLQIVVISAYLLLPIPAPALIQVLQSLLLWITVAFTLITGLDYLKVLVPALKAQRR
ncbi:MAG: putative CDP-diacylglycerol--glycerol-3-phosphate 3-phosphatidyl-transferase 2 [Actinomycetota bacterium]|jgi:CDP-diacylglycerol--glycerol-3-phosphate 3-phosphatidyltransferase